MTTTKEPQPNYFIYCLHRMMSCGDQNLTLKQAYDELKNVGGFGIANATTGKPILRRTNNGFTLPTRLSKQFPHIERKLIRTNHLFY